MVKDRLNQYLKYKRLGMREFSRLCDVEISVLSRISEATSPKTLRKIEDKSDLNTDWLMCGNGDMIKHKSAGTAATTNDKVPLSFNRVNDMADISKRIQNSIDECFNHNKAAFARAVGISPTTLASYLNPKRASKPTSDFLTAVVERLGIDATWLLTGNGKMYKDEVINCEDVNTLGANLQGKIVGNTNYTQKHSVDAIVKEDITKEVVEIHSPKDLHQIELLTIKLTFLSTQNNEQKETISDLRETVKELREHIKELKAEQK